MPRLDRSHLYANKSEVLPKTTMSEELNITSKFGSEMRQHFLLGDGDQNCDVAFCNHGSYGATPRHVMKKRAELLQHVEANPDLWYRSEMLKQELESTEKLANFVGADPADIVYVNNVTEGMNIILKVNQQSFRILKHIKINLKAYYFILFSYYFSH